MARRLGSDGYDPYDPYKIEYCSKYIDNGGCPDPCRYSYGGSSYGGSTSCDCTYPGGIDADPHCVNCQSPRYGGSGCIQCEYGYFKPKENYKCVHCQGLFGDGCLHCADNVGCQQCDFDNGFSRVYDYENGIYYCEEICPVPVPTMYPTPPTWSPTPRPTWKPTRM